MSPGAVGTLAPWGDGGAVQRELSGQALRCGGDAVLGHTPWVLFLRPGWAGKCNWFIRPSLFIPLIIRFTFPFLPLDPAVTMGTMFTVAFHWLLEKLLSPFPPVSFHFSSLDTELWLSEDGEPRKASDNQD